MDSWLDGPPEEAYGRVTDPQRFAPLLAAARELLDGLERHHAVVRQEGLALDPGVVERVDAVSLERLAPLDERAAPLVVCTTAFPGLLVRFGRWHTEAFPSCGCDACDEQPDEVVGDLRRQVGALVGGRFTEELTGGLRPWLRHAFAGDDGASSGEVLIDRARARATGRRSRLDWAPWPCRTGG